MSIEQYVNKCYLKRVRADLHLERGEQIAEGAQWLGTQARRGRDQVRSLFGTPKRA